MNLLFRFVTELNCVDFHTHKRPQKEFRFMGVPYTSALARMSVLKKLQLSYDIEKIGFLTFFSPTEKAFIL